ncbi:xylulokinase [Candidatus Thorarchaeota archaeon]|nr:MAG: xylulokinase [Candidatus Thorarchaeota archaeon]
MRVLFLERIRILLIREALPNQLVVEMAEYVLAIDVGTSGVRSIIFDTNGEVKASAYDEFTSMYPRPSWVEQNADAWWSAATDTTRLALKETTLSGEDIIGISVTNQRETIVPVDEYGTPLRHAIVWQDRRTTVQCDAIRSRIPVEKIYHTTGLTVDPYFSAPKILWIKDNEPEVFKKTHKFLLVHDYLVHKLAGNYVTDYSNASRTLLFDIDASQWSDLMLNELEIPTEKMPKPVSPGTKAGELTTKAAESMGLERGTPIIAGGGDQQCAALGVGVVEEGMIKATTGTGTFILAHSDALRLDDERRVLCSRHVVPESYVVEASMFTTGSALRWVRDNIAIEECNIAEKRNMDPYDIMTAEAEQISPGSEGVIHIPHLAGAGAPYWNPHARGVFAGLALGHTRSHMIRSVLEGVSYEIRANLEVMRSLGLPSDEVRITGGAARSETWMQIQADVLGVPVIRTELEDATALGAAILACYGVGIFKSISAAAREMVRLKDQLKPSEENRTVYDTAYERYRELYDAISEIRLDTI